MYISTCLFDTTCVFVDAGDEDFFKSSLDNAIALFEKFKDQTVNPDVVKQNTPICHVSTLWKKTDEEVAVSRKEVHGDRARRKFIMIEKKPSLISCKRSSKLSRKSTRRR